MKIPFVISVLFVLLASGTLAFDESNYLQNKAREDRGFAPIGRKRATSVQPGRLIVMEHKSTFTVIHHELLSEHNISCVEYCILDIAYQLSRKRDWCSMGKERIGRILNISKRTVLYKIERLAKTGR